MVVCHVLLYYEVRDGNSCDAAFHIVLSYEDIAGYYVLQIVLSYEDIAGYYVLHGQNNFSAVSHSRLLRPFQHELGF